jgi:hypothetical protein
MGGRTGEVVMFGKLKKDLRARGIWITAEEALIIERALGRARVSVTEPGADVITKFMKRCEELKRE